MQVFYHLVYEYQKGLRDLCLWTCRSELYQKIKKTLESQEIDYLIIPVDKTKINIFFGMSACLEIIKHFSSTELNKITDEEDFILGMMLGYARQQQYHRFLTRKKVCA